jgi:acyl carrier protein
MTSQEILVELNSVFARVFARPGLTVTPTTTAKDVEDWDSLNHTRLIAEVQKHFKVKLSLREVMKLQNVGDMVTLLQAKVGGESGPPQRG